MSHPMICDSCERGMIYDIRTDKCRCYVCLRECHMRSGCFFDFDPTYEFLQYDDSSIYAAIRAEVAKHSQKVVASRMNVSTQYLNDLVKGRRPISPVVSAYYWLDRVTVYVPRFTKPKEAE